MARLKSVLSLMIIISSVSLSAMEMEKHDCDDKCYQEVRKRIDKEILGVESEGLLASVSGMIASYRQCPSDREGTIKAFQNVESKIPAPCNNFRLFQDLKRWHWYFGNLIDNAISYKHEQWNNITGVTIGNLLSTLSEKNLDSRLSGTLHSYIHCQALQPYCKEIELWQDMEKRNFELDDIHYTVLPGNGMGMQSISFIQSPEWKCYVKKVGWDESTKFYSLEDGKECMHEPSILYATTCPVKQYKVHRWGHMIVFGLVDLLGIRAIMQNLYANSDHRKIVVFVMPTFESFLCSKAFAASKNNKEELTTMREFVKKTPLVQGFVKRNLLQKITGRLKELET